MKSGNDILKTYSQHWFSEDVEMEDDTSFVKLNDALAAMEEHATQFQSSPKYIDELYLLQKSINAADPFGNDILIKDLKKQIDSIISKAETPGNVSPQAAVVAEEKFFTTDEVWRMYSEDPAYGHKSYKEFAEENGWVMVRLKAAPTPTEEQEVTIGRLIREAIALHELNPDIVEKELKLPVGVVTKLMNDEIYTNSVPVVLFKNLILSLHIPLKKIEAAMLPTFKLLVSKETPESLKKKPHGYALWENEESVIKYTERLKEII